MNLSRYLFKNDSAFGLRFSPALKKMVGDTTEYGTDPSLFGSETDDDLCYTELQRLRSGGKTWRDTALVGHLADRVKRISDILDEGFRRGGWDYTYLLEHAARTGMKFSADFVGIDEINDLTPLQIAICARSEGERVIFSGDPDQCHPAGTVIKTSDGDKLIENLRTGDSVMSWSRKHQGIKRKDNIKVASRDYIGKMFTATAGGVSAKMTANHRVLVRLNKTKQSKDCVVYLMYRKGFGFRVGWCQVFNSEGGTHMFARARMEKADGFWILKVFEDRKEASIYESIVAAKYGLPTVTFEPVHDAVHLVSPAIHTIFDALKDTNTQRGEECLDTHNLDSAYPLYPIRQHPSDPYPSVKYKRTTLFATAVCNILPGMMSLLKDDRQWHVVEKIEAQKVKDEKVYSLDVEKNHTYFANNLMVLNCIFAWNGVQPSELWNLPGEVQLREESYRVPSVIAEYAEKIIRRSTDKRIGQIKSLKEGGEVVHDMNFRNVICNTLLKTPTLVLARTNYILEKAKEEALSYGVNIAASSAEKLQAELGSLIRHPTPNMNFAQAGCFLGTWLPAMEYFKKGGKKRLRLRVLKDERGWMTWDELFSSYGTPNLHDLMMGRKTWYTGSPKFDPAKPVARFMTIHSAKGLEDNTVVVLRDMGNRVHNNLHMGESDEIRLAYVAATRAEKKLIISQLDPCGAGNPYLG
uniref:Putative helicase n=2 Tax=viral metagenome TaxID=1070528 RepID=A0A6M3IVN1_9ZZZZ